jgi:hypothetical protein
VENILSFTLVCTKNNYSMKNKIVYGYVISKVLLHPMERLRSMVYGVNPNRKSPKAEVKGAPTYSNR